MLALLYATNQQQLVVVVVYAAAARHFQRPVVDVPDSVTTGEGCVGVAGCTHGDSEWVYGLRQ